MTTSKVTKTWEESLKVGEIGEDVFAEYMNYLGDNEIIDVRYDKAWQVKDIDYLVYSDNEDMYTVDVKTDCKIGEMRVSKYRRFFIEDIQNVRINSDGFFRYCEADILAYYDSIKELMYLVDWNELKEYINYFYYESVNKNRVEYVSGNNSLGYGVYIDKCEQWFNDNDKYFKVVNMKEVI